MNTFILTAEEALIKELQNAEEGIAHWTKHRENVKKALEELRNLKKSSGLEQTPEKPIKRKKSTSIKSTKPVMKKTGTRSAVRSKATTEGKATAAAAPLVKVEKGSDKLPRLTAEFWLDMLDQPRTRQELLKAAQNKLGSLTDIQKTKLEQNMSYALKYHVNESHKLKASGKGPKRIYMRGEAA